MTIDTKDLLNSILSNLARIDYVKPEDLPNIDLYMDQVTTFMDRQLAASKRFEEDKILTKTMINNYAKNDLLPPPQRKKYTKEHILTLIFIYYFKNILSISDIQAILNPVTEKYFGGSGQISLEDIYAEVFRLEKSEGSHLQKDIARKFQLSRETFGDVDEANREDMQMFAFICLLCFDVYVKKQLIENIIDSRVLTKPEEAAKKSKKAEEAAKKARKAEEAAKKP